MIRSLAAVLLTGVLATSVGAAPPDGGKVLFQRSGVIQRPSLRVTQDTFLVHNHCRGTDLNGTETNGLSAAVLDVSAYAGQQLSVSYIDEIALGGFFYVTFYTRDCQLTEISDDPWAQKSLARPAVGRIPLRAAWVMLARAGGTVSASFPLPYGQMSWDVVVRPLPPVVAKPPAKALCKQVVDPKGDEPDAQLDVVSADIAVDATAVTVGIRLADLEVSDPAVPLRAYIVEFTVPDGGTLFLGMWQDNPGLHLIGTSLRPVAGTKDASGYHIAYVPTRTWFDTETGEIRVSAPLARPKQGESLGTIARFDRGKRLTAITARTVDGSLDKAPPLRRDRDVATTTAPYVIGTPTCLQRVVD